MAWAEMAAGLLLDCLESFGEPVSHQPRGGASPPVPLVNGGIFDDSASQVDASGEISATAPQLTVRLADFPADAPPQQEDAIWVRGERYWIYDPQPDGHGGVRLELRKGVP